MLAGMFLTQKMTARPHFFNHVQGNVQIFELKFFEHIKYVERDLGIQDDLFGVKDHGRVHQP